MFSLELRRSPLAAFALPSGSTACFRFLSLRFAAAYVPLFAAALVPLLTCGPLCVALRCFLFFSIAIGVLAPPSTTVGSVSMLARAVQYNARRVGPSTTSFCCKD